MRLILTEKEAKVLTTILEFVGGDSNGLRREVNNIQTKIDAHKQYKTYKCYGEVTFDKKWAKTQGLID